MSSPARKLGIIGAGPATVYLLYHLYSMKTRFAITILEHQADAGRGLPYCQANSPFSLLSNLLPDEIPPTVVTFREWCAGNGVVINNQPVPRYLIGQFLHWSLTYLIARSADVRVVTSCLANSIFANREGGFTVSSSTCEQFDFHDVIINTGHGVIQQQSGIQIAYPLNELVIAEQVKRINLIGSSMSAIDCALFVAQKFGAFQTSCGKETYVATKAHKITMYSTSGQLPLPFFRSRDFQTEITELVGSEKKFTDFQSLEDLYQRVFLHLLSSYAPNLYCQCRFKTFSQFIRCWQLSVLHPNAVASLKLGMLMITRNAEFSIVLAIFEAFFASLCELKIRFTREDDQFISRICMPFLAKHNGALPSLSAGRILALIEAGVLLVERGQTASDLSAQHDSDTTVTIDCRGAANSARNPLTRCFTERGMVQFAHLPAHQESRRIETDNEYRAYMSSKGQSAIYIGSVPLLSKMSKTLPGIGVTASVARHIAGSLNHRSKDKNLMKDRGPETRMPVDVLTTSAT